MLEETGLALVSPQYAYAVNSVFEASGKHYVTGTPMMMILFLGWRRL